MIHSCSYYCHKPECIKEQRDELREKLFKREWVGLTDEEIETLYYAVDGNEFPLDFYKEIEAKLKEKNSAS